MIQALLGHFSYKGTIQSLTRATRFITEGECWAQTFPERC